MQVTQAVCKGYRCDYFNMASSNVVQIKPNSQIKSGAEYVSGNPFFSDHPRVLPIHDEFSSQRDVLPHETVEAMLTDPDVFAGLMLLALMTLNEELMISPAIEAGVDETEDNTADPSTALQPDTTKPADNAATSTPKDNVPTENVVDSEATPAKPIDPNVKKAAEISEFCQRQVDRVPKFESAVFQLVFEGLAHGNKVAEQVLEIAARGVDTGKWCLKAVKPKPRTAVAFVVDAYNNEIGMLGAKPGQMQTVQTSFVADDRDIIPREKFVVFTYRPKNDDPRGHSALVAARNGWEMKTRTFPEYLLFLMVSAIPGILATLEDGAEEITLYEDDGITVRRNAETGEPLTVSASQFLLNMLGKMRNHQVGVAPAGTEFTLLEANKEGEVFTRALDKFGSEITMAVLFQHLATRDSTHQTKGATSSQFQVIDLIVFWLRDTAANMVRNDIFKPLVRYNFGDDAADELLPKVSYGDTEARDWANDAQAGDLTESQWLHVTTQLGIPAPTESEKAMKKAAKMLAQQGAAAMANGTGEQDKKGGDAAVKETSPATGGGKGKDVPPPQK